ncbi:MAG: hypothetical protein ACE15C_08520 [Phycisphaerae bacterium]
MNYAVPVRWSWTHWWEANRDQYLLSVRQGPAQKLDQKTIEGYRRQATGALM